MDVAKMVSGMASQCQSRSCDDMRGIQDDQDNAMGVSRDTASHAADGQPQSADSASSTDDASPEHHRLSLLANAPAIDHPALTSKFIEAKWTPDGQTCCSTGAPNTESTALSQKYTMFLPNGTPGVAKAKLQDALMVYNRHAGLGENASGALGSFDVQRFIEPCKVEYPNLA